MDPWFDYEDENVQIAFTPFVYEMHGNVFYMHCSRESEPHARKLIKAPHIEEF